MPFFPSPCDGAQLFYADYRPSTSVAAFQPDPVREGNISKDVALVFLHGWPNSSEESRTFIPTIAEEVHLIPSWSGRLWDRQILPLVESYGIRCIALDRRGFGRSEWTGTGGDDDHDVTYDTFAQDTAALLQSVKDLKGFIFVCTSMGCGESVLVQQKLDSAGDGSRCKGFIWLTPSLPYPLQTDANPGAPSRELWDAIVGGLRTDRHAFVKASIGGVFGTHVGVEISDEARDFFIRLIERNDIVAVERCVQLLSNYDFTRDLQKLAKEKRAGLPVVVVAGQDDNSQFDPSLMGVLIADSSYRLAT